jgi:alpha-ribazole phosphatase
MLEIILVRHGETDGNVQGRYLGWTDETLNKNGMDQAYLLKEKLKNAKPDYIYSSSLERCRRTAMIINEAHDVDIIYSDDLKERNFGLFDNLKYGEICEKYPELQKLWEGDWENYVIESGESAFGFHKRICRYIDGITVQKRNGKLLIVTHSGCIRSIIAQLLGLKLEDAWHFRIDNCGITRFEIRDNFPVMTLLNG